MGTNHLPNLFAHKFSFVHLLGHVHTVPLKVNGRFWKIYRLLRQYLRINEAENQDNTRETRNCNQ
jgi:hypothetical protein